MCELFLILLIGFSYADPAKHKLADELFELGLRSRPDRGSVFTGEGYYGTAGDWVLSFRSQGIITQPLIEISKEGEIDSYRFPDEVQRYSNSFQDIFSNQSQNQGEPLDPNLKDFFDGTPKAVLDRILGSGIEGAADFTERDATILQVVNQGLGMESGGALLQYLHEATIEHNLTRNEKLAIVQTFGGLFLSNYDEERNKKWIRAKGGVGLTQLLNAYQSNINVTAEGKVYAGVCRDISTGQALMLRAMGFKDSFVIAFMRTDGIYHTTVAAADPYARGSDRRTLIKIDYARRQESEGLYQGIIDSALNYIVMEPDGTTVANIPSDLGFLLSAAAGGHSENLDFLARPRISLGGVNVQGGSGGSIQARVFAGNTDHSLVVGIGADVQYLRETLFPGRVGLVIAYQNRFFSDANNFLFYLDIEQAAKTPELIHQLDKKTKLILQGEIMAKIQVMVHLLNEEWIAGIQGNLVITPRIRVELEREELRLKAILGAHLPIGLRDSNDVRSLMIIPTEGFVGLEGRYKLPSEERTMVLLARMMAMFSQLGTRGRLEAGLAIDEVMWTLFLEGRGPGWLIRDLPPLYREWERRIGTRVNFGGVFNLEFTHSLESNDWEAGYGIDVSAVVGQFGQKNNVAPFLFGRDLGVQSSDEPQESAHSDHLYQEVEGWIVEHHPVSEVKAEQLLGQKTLPLEDVKELGTYLLDGFSSTLALQVASRLGEVMDSWTYDDELGFEMVQYALIKAVLETSSGELQRKILEILFPESSLHFTTEVLLNELRRSAGDQIPYFQKS